MRNDNQLLLLHLSDLHFGENSRYRDVQPQELACRLSSAISTELSARKIECRVKMAVVTGDVSEKGSPDEFVVANSFLETLSTELNLDKRRFVFAPGNHDISWTECKHAEVDAEAQGLSSEEAVKDRIDSSPGN